MPVFNEKMETMPRKKLDEIKFRRFKKIISYAYEKNSFYREKFKKAGIKPDDIKSMDDIQKIPFTTKDELRNNMPFGMLAVPLEKCIELHASSGTTGIPVTVCYTKHDIEVWSEVMARCLSMAGLTRKDIFQIPIPYGTFTGAFGFHYGGQRVGALIVPSGKSESERQIELMKYYGTTFIAGIASYAVRLGRVASKMGVDVANLNVRNGIFGAETFTSEMKRRISEMWDMDVHDIYGLTEMCGPGVSADCDMHDGLHIWEDHFFPEIIDIKTGDVIEKEEEGELVLTTLTKEGMPVIRYRTRDITYLYDGECECGRTHVRHAPIKGRSDDMVIVRGTNLFPGQIEEVIMKDDRVGENWLMLIERNDMDEVTLQIEAKRKIDEKEAKKLAMDLQKKLHIVTTLRMNVEVLQPDTLPKHEGKAKHVIDRRK